MHQALGAVLVHSAFPVLAFAQEAALGVAVSALEGGGLDAQH